MWARKGIDRKREKERERERESKIKESIFKPALVPLAMFVFIVKANQPSWGKHAVGVIVMNRSASATPFIFKHINSERRTKSHWAQDSLLNGESCAQTCTFRLRGQRQVCWVMLKFKPPRIYAVKCQAIRGKRKGLCFLNFPPSIHSLSFFFKE